MGGHESKRYALIKTLLVRKNESLLFFYCYSNKSIRLNLFRLSPTSIRSPTMTTNEPRWPRQSWISRWLDQFEENEQKKLVGSYRLRMLFYQIGLVSLEPPQKADGSLLSIIYLSPWTVFYTFFSKGLRWNPYNLGKIEEKVSLNLRNDEFVKVLCRTIFMKGKRSRSFN